MVYNSTSSCFSKSGTKFALHVTSKFKVWLVLYSESDAPAWAATSLPELNGPGLLVRNEKPTNPSERGEMWGTRQRDEFVLAMQREPATSSPTCLSSVAEQILEDSDVSYDTAQ